MTETVLPSLPETPPWMSFKEGGPDLDGNPIAYLVSANQTCCVYIKAPETVSWCLDADVSVDANASLSEAMVLLSQINTTVARRSVRLQLKRAVALALAKALDDRVINETRDFFVDVRKFIDTVRHETLHLQYFVAAFLTVAGVSVSALVVASLVPEARTFLMSAIFGGVGAFVSVAQRFRQIPIEHYSSRLYVSMAGFSRIVLGSLFGALLLLLHRADLLLSIAEKQPYLLATASFVAGFSERLIPEILERFESRVANEPVGTA